MSRARDFKGVSNREDWAFNVEGIAEDGSAINFSTAQEITFEIADPQTGGMLASATKTGGGITTPVTGYFLVSIPRATAAEFGAGVYPVGVTVKFNDVVTQALIDTIHVIDGVVSQ